MELRINLLTYEIGNEISKRIANVGLVIAQSTLPKSTQELVNLRASQINGCGWCIDMHTKEAAAAGETEVRLNLVAAWREATVFTEAERAALAFAEEGTRLADAHLGVSDETWAQVRKHSDDDQIVALVSLVALINAANRLAVILHQQGVPTSLACSPACRADRQTNPGPAQDHPIWAGPAHVRGRGCSGSERAAERGDLTGQSRNTLSHALCRDEYDGVEYAGLPAKRYEFVNCVAAECISTSSSSLHVSVGLRRSGSQLGKPDNTSLGCGARRELVAHAAAR
jgi:AhpD family alkylhydroperoxidase